jgi:kynurenine formamidase
MADAIRVGEHLADCIARDRSEADEMTSSQGTGTGPAPVPPGRMSKAEFQRLYDRLRAQPPWGPADRRGALNYLAPATMLAAAGEVKLGRSVSMGGPIEYGVTADNPEPARHKMTQIGDSAASGLSFAMDQIGMDIHGNADTHIDALSHVSYDGRLYNNRPADIVSDTGAAELSIAAAADGITGRGVLLDVPRARGVAWLEPGDCVSADDLTAAERDQQVEVGQGDLVFIRVGHSLRRFQLGPWDAADARAGLHPAAMEYLADRKIALLGSDGNNDTAPSVVPGVDFPVHVLAIAALGVHLIDYLDFAVLAPLCAEFRQWSFLCVIAPLRLAVATGSPVNPIAIL